MMPMFPSRNQKSDRTRVVYFSGGIFSLSLTGMLWATKGGVEACSERETVGQRTHFFYDAQWKGVSLQLRPVQWLTSG